MGRRDVHGKCLTLHIKRHRNVSETVLIDRFSAKIAPNPSVGIGEILEGTGKFAGITGKMEYTSWGMRPASEESHQGMAKLTKLKLTWQMPEKQPELQSLDHWDTSYFKAGPEMALLFLLLLAYL
ncbi:MAG: hypothetical protein ACQ9MH_21105 [Nitrospinales bacterium]